jgi:glycopeptide antibiotics resistance protein
MTSRRKRTLALIAYIIFLLNLAFFQFTSKSATPNVIPLRSIGRDIKHGGLELVVNLLGNIVAFVPMGLLLPLIRTRPTRLWHVIVFSLALSASIEAGQLYSGRRVPDVDDLILNSLGGAAGYFLLKRLQRARVVRELTSADSSADGDHNRQMACARRTALDRSTGPAG